MASFRGETNYNLSGLPFLGNIYPVVDWTYEVKDDEIKVAATLSLEWSGLASETGNGEFTISIRVFGVASEENVEEVIEKRISKPIGYAILEIGTAEATFTFSEESTPEIIIKATGSMTDPNTNETVFEIEECEKNVGQLAGNDLILHFPESSLGELRRETVVGGALKVEGKTTLNDTLVIGEEQEDNSSLALRLFGRAKLFGSVGIDYRSEEDYKNNPWLLQVSGPTRISTVNLDASYALEVAGKALIYRGLVVGGDLVVLGGTSLKAPVQISSVDVDPTTFSDALEVEGDVLFSNNLVVEGDLTLGGYLKGGRVRLWSGTLTAGKTVELDDDLSKYRQCYFVIVDSETYPLSVVHGASVRASSAHTGNGFIQVFAVRGDYTQATKAFKLEKITMFSITPTGIYDGSLSFNTITEIWGIK